jgi:hypothetical protein
MRSTILFSLLVLGCGNSSPQLNITKTIDSSGGMVSASDGTNINVPMGALSMSTSITITPVNVQPPAGTVLVGQAYDFQPEGTQFAQGVTITLPFDMSKIPSGLSPADIVIYTAPSGTTNYTSLFTQLGSGTVSTSTTHLSIYLPATPAAACTPVCTSGMGSGGPTCGCTATCNSQQQVISCSTGSGGMLFCFCELNHQTMSAPTITSCTDIQSAFSACFAG